MHRNTHSREVIRDIVYNIENISREIISTLTITSVIGIGSKRIPSLFIYTVALCEES